MDKLIFPIVAEKDAPIINPVAWKEKHPHFTGFVKKLDCGCHAKLLAVTPTESNGTINKLSCYAAFRDNPDYSII